MPALRSAVNRPARPAVMLVAGGDAGAREAAVAHWLAGRDGAEGRCAVILEGVPDRPADFDAAVSVVRLAPACPCCTGNLALRVTLNRILRQPPATLIIGIAQPEHLDALRTFLTQPPYGEWLTLTGLLTP